MRLWRSQAAFPVAYLLLTLIAAAVYVDVDASSSVRDWLMVAIPVWSVLAVGAGISLYRPERRDVWYFIVAAQVAGAVGAGVWHAKFGVHHAAPMPGGWQDVFFLAFYVLLAAALIIVLRRSELGNQGVVDAAIFAAGGMLLVLLVLVEPNVAGSGLPTVGRAVQIASAFADVCL